MSPDTVIITRLADGVILDVNDSFSKATGYSREEVIGRNSVAELHLWTDPKERRKYVGEILRKGLPAIWNCISELKTEVYVWVPYVAP